MTGTSSAHYAGSLSTKCG